MIRFIVLITTFLFVLTLKAQEQPIPYAQADRDRMVRLETKAEAVDKRIDDLTLNINARFSEMNRKLDRLKDKFNSYFMWGFGLVLMSIFGLIGFVIYDRRTTLAPVESKTEKIIKALKEAAEKDPALRDALKRTALW
jgi:hypothetical protein